MKNGYTILIVILVLTAVGILIITTVNFLGVDETKMSLSQRDSGLGLYLSTACAEEALMRIRERATYTTSGLRILIDSARRYYCWFSVVNRDPPKYIYTRSEIANFPRNLEIKIESIERRTGRIKIGYWIEK